MPKQVNNRILVAIRDLFFTVKIIDSAKRALMVVETASTREELLEKVKNNPALIIFDLNLEAMEPVRTITELKGSPETKGISLMGFVSHVDGVLKKEAQDAGCDIVMARSAFSQNLPQILKRYSGVL